MKKDAEAALAIAAQASAPAGKGGKADPKAAAKAAPKPGAKGTAPVDDKNIPQAQEVKYPTINQEPQILIIERNFA